MYKKILICFDGSEGSKKALQNGITVAKTFNADVLALWVKGSLPHYPETIDEIEQEKYSADSFFNNLKKEIDTASKEEGINIDLKYKFGNPSKIILDYATEHKIDLITMGHRGHSGLWGNFLGHVTDKVSENAVCDVLIVR